jgi:hypothetical protein
MVSINRSQKSPDFGLKKILLSSLSINLQLLRKEKMWNKKIGCHLRKNLPEANSQSLIQSG